MAGVARCGNKADGVIKSIMASDGVANGHYVTNHVTYVLLLGAGPEGQEKRGYCWLFLL